MSGWWELVLVNETYHCLVGRISDVDFTMGSDVDGTSIG